MQARWIDRWAHGWLVGRMDVLSEDRRLPGWMNGWLDASMAEMIRGWMDG